MSDDDNITVGLSEAAHLQLQQLKDDGVISEMRDGYRFGLALAIASKQMASPDVKFKTFLNVGSLDPDGAIRDVIVELFPDSATKPYAIAERLAEAGVAELGRLHEAGQLRFGDLFDVGQTAKS